jgi:uncharacterized alkaline shock family protein YloU
MSDDHTITRDEGTVTLTAGVLSHIVVASAETVDGARVRRGRRGLDVAVEDGTARVELELAVRYGDVLPVVAEEVQRRVRAALQDMCALETSTVDVSVEELDG